MLFFHLCCLFLDDDGGDLFFTPPSSPRGSPIPSTESDSDGEEMDVPEEGPAVFIEGYGQN